MFGRRQNHFKVAAWTVGLISISLNVYFIITSKLSWYDGWVSSTRHEGMLRVMRYIESEREIEGQIRDEFVDEVWNCMKDAFSASAGRSVAEQQNAPVLSNLESRSRSSSSWNGNSLLKQNSQPSRSSTFDEYDDYDDYAYISDHADACANGDISVIIVSPSSPYSSDRRMTMRQGRVGQFAGDPKNRAKMLFFVGMPTDSDGQRASEIQDKLNAEQAKFQDIVQSTFIDTYKNMTRKGLLLPKWLSTFCSQADIALRIDDDVDANVTEMVLAVKEARRRLPHFILGVMREGLRPRRDKSSKYFVSFEEYPYRTWPKFLLGGSLGYPVDTAKVIFEACRRVFPEIWLDDVWVTAMCARRVALPIFNSSAFYFNHNGQRFTRDTP